MFSWRYLDRSGRDMGCSEPFGDRSSAEEWMGRFWEELAARGVHEVVLLDEERSRRVYRMGLAPE